MSIFAIFFFCYPCPLDGMMRLSMNKSYNGKTGGVLNNRRLRYLNRVKNRKPWTYFLKCAKTDIPCFYFLGPSTMELIEAVKRLGFDTTEFRISFSPCVSVDVEFRFSIVSCRIMISDRLCTEEQRTYKTKTPKITIIREDTWENLGGGGSS